MDASEVAEIMDNAVGTVFSTMLGTELAVARWEESAEPTRDAEVIALIGMGGEMRGSVSLQCEKSMACAFTARLLGMDASEVESDEDLRDGLGEVVNMIAGSLKTALLEHGSIEIAIPIVVLTPKCDIRIKAKFGVSVTFTDTLGEFVVDFVLEADPPS